MNQPNNSAQHSEAPSVRDGEIVTLTLGGASAKCMVFQTNGKGAVLIPKQITPAFQSAIEKMPVSGKMDAASGSSAGFKLTSKGAIPALAGELSGMNYEARRQSFRIKLDYSAKISTDGKSWSNVRGVDISEGGLMLAIDDRVTVTVGQAILMVIYLPECEPVTASGVIRRLATTTPGKSTADRVGIQFTNMSADDSRRFRQYIYNYQRQFASTA